MRIIANFGRSLALFVPTFFCLYALSGAEKSEKGF